MAFNLTTKNRQVLIYGVSLAFLLLLLKWMEWRFLIIDHAVAVYAGAIAVFFTLLGIWLAQKLMKPKEKTIIIEKPVFIGQAFVSNEAELANLKFKPP